MSKNFPAQIRAGCVCVVVVVVAVKLGTNISSLSAQRLLSAATEKVFSAAERLSSGQRINKASDDAAGLAISMSLNANSRVLAQAARNINDTVSLTSISEGAMHQLEEITVRHKELAEQAANGVYSTKQRQAMDAEAKALTNEYNRIILTTKFNGQSILSNSWEEMRTQVGTGAENSLAFKFADELATKVTAGSYFTINSPDGAYYVWYTIDGQGTDPHAEGTGIRVDLSTQDVAGTSSVAGVAGEFQAQFNNGGSFSGGEYFYASTPTSSYIVWFDYEGGFQDPGDPGGRNPTQSLDVYIEAGYSEDDIANAVASRLNGTGEFSVSNDGGGNLTVTNTALGAVQFGAYITGNPPFNVFQVTAGTDAVTGTARTKNIEPTKLRDAVATALATTGKFSTQVATDGSLIVTDSVGGRAVDIKDVSSGNILIDTLSQGTGMSFVDYGEDGDSSVWMMKAADLNGDGALDMIASGYGGIQVRLNDGTGEFGTETSYTTGSTPTDLELVDINGDGKLDVINTNYTGSSLSVRLGRGDGTFGTASSYSIYNSSVQISVGDLNGDGRPDLATSSTGGVNILLNQGNGIFGAATSLAGAGEYVELGDIDHDGRLDMVTTTYNGTSANVRLGNGNGTFRVATSYALGGAGSNATVLKDINNDGWLDFATTTVFNSSTSVLVNNRAGGFAAPNVISSGLDTAGIDFADINNDGNMDLVTGDYSTNVVMTRLGNGNGTFRAATSYSIGPVYSAYNGIYKIQTADLDNDGKVDILAEDSGHSRIAVLWGNGAGGVEASKSEVTRLVFGDARGMTLVNQLNLTTRKGALAALDTLTSRLDRIHKQIGVMGATTARLDSALRVTASTRENYIAADSRIKDADIATESAKYTQSRILQQVAQSVLAQANQIPELALTLLKY